MVYLWWTHLKFHRLKQYLVSIEQLYHVCVRVTMDDWIRHSPILLRRTGHVIIIRTGSIGKLSFSFLMCDRPDMDSYLLTGEDTSIYPPNWRQASRSSSRKTSSVIGMTTAGQALHVCQRCCNPLRLHRDFENLEHDKVLALVDAQRPERDDSRPPIIIPVKNFGAEYPHYVVPPNPGTTHSEAEALSLLRRYSTPAVGLDHRHKVSSALFDILSGRTEVDHPLCQDCADVLLTARQQCLEYQEEELNCLRSYMSYLDGKAARAESKIKSSETRAKAKGFSGAPPPESSSAGRPPDALSPKPHDQDEPDTSTSNWLSCLSLSDQPGTLFTLPSSSTQPSAVGDDELSSSESLEGWSSASELDVGAESQGPPRSATESRSGARRPKRRLSELQKEVAELQAQLADVLAEGAKLDQQVTDCTAELARRTEELDRAQTQYNEQKQNLIEAEEELWSLDARVKYAKRHLDRLLRTNVLNTVFPIWYSGHFGIINGLHLGRLSDRPVSWDEINAAWGQCAMLLQCIARKLNYTFQGYRVVPLGSQSKVVDSTNDKEYPLYYATTGRQLFGFSKFDNAMCIFLKCLHQVEKVVETMTQSRMPYLIQDGGKIHDPEERRTYSIKWSGNSEENWTKALKGMLLNMKWIIARLVALDGQRRISQLGTDARNALASTASGSR
ncbi:hypothetical protein CRM22_007622 [Opisthorchis felineus]|uniref:Atg6 BARA domain-containing protein n=1 Tax=Opisthorchis felineus TaxID=147828 RepID=A0A4V3SDV5_OPIFE|nr:hypothetical protein CRM22_007622 [Opisthorchis felineus]